MFNPAAQLYDAMLRGRYSITVLTQNEEDQPDGFVLIEQPLAGDLEPPEHLVHLAEDVAVDAKPLS